jgi:flagellar biosynthesis protein FlhG
MPILDSRKPASVSNLPLARPVRVIAVTSGKGGVGKTTVSVNLAMAMAERGKEVVLLDADLGLANVDVLLGLKADYNLSHVISGERSLDEIMVTAPGGVRVIPGASGVRRMTELSEREQGGLIYAFSGLASSTDVLIVDTPAGIGTPVINFCSAAQEALVVVCNDPASLTDAYATIKVLNQASARTRFRILVNQARSAQEGQTLFQKLVEATGRFLDVSLDLVGTIPFDPCIPRSGMSRRAVYSAYPGAGSVAGFKKLAERADKWPVPGTASGQLEFFAERMIQGGAAEGRWAQA